MSDEVSNLVIKVDSGDVKSADDRLGHLSQTSAKAESATGNLVGAVKGLVAAYLSVEGAMKFAEKLFDTTVEYQRLQAQVLTATGSLEGSKAAFQALQDLAAQTPFTLAEVTNAYTNLVNKGLDPSRAAMIAYGNVATALNLSLETVTDAVSQASNGQFRGLMQLGIKVEEVSDGLVLNFHGVATKIRKDVGDIQNYIQNLGNSNFADAMKNRMNTLEGATHELKHAWDELFNSISQQGGASVLTTIFKVATDAIHELTDEISSGQLAGYVQALMFKFDSLADGIHNAIANVTDVIEMAFQYWSTDGKGVVDFLIGAFKNLPENIKAVMQAVGASFGILYDTNTATVKLIWEEFRAFFEYVINTAKDVGLKFWDLLKHPAGGGKFDFTAEQGKAFDSFIQKTTDGWETYTSGIKNSTSAWSEQITAIMDERDTSIASFNAQIDRANALREAYDKNKKAREESEKGSDDPLKNAPKGSERGGHINTQREQAEFEQLRKQLNLEEQTIQESYEHRKEIIQNAALSETFTAKDKSAMLKELDVQVTEEYEKAFQDRGSRVMDLQQQLDDAIAQGRLSEVDGLREMLAHEETIMRASYEKRRQQILQDTTKTEAQKNKKLLDLENQYTQQQRELEDQRQRMMLNRAADFFGNISTIAQAFGAKGAKIAKAAAIVQATIKTYESATSAYSAMAGIPYIGPALGAVAAAAAIAAGMANVAAIKSQNYSGAYEYGGMIPSGMYGMAGEAGPELIRGPAVVTSARATADLMGKRDGGNTQINIINSVSGIEVAQTGQRDTPDGKVIDMIVRKTTAQIANGIRTDPRHPVTSAIEASYAVRRGTG